MDAPSYPSPTQTAAAQTGANQSTAITQQLLNMVNQQGPYGSLSYSPTGTYSYRDPTTGKTVTLPQFTGTTTLTPAQQGLLNQQQQFGKITNQIGITQAGKIGQLLNTPVDLNNSATEGRIDQLAQARLDPVWGQRENALQQQLQNRGVAPGSEAWNRANQQFQNSRNDAYNQMLLQGRQEAVNEALTQRNQPINEITALMAGGQVQQPNFVNTPSTNVQGTDVSGLINNQYNAQNQQYQGMLGGLFGLGSSALGGWASSGFSDKRLKKQSKKIGKLNDGTPIHSFKYKNGLGGGLMHIGVMAQEVEKKHPKAVADTGSGFKKVNYSKLAEEMKS
jgi:hypothetical protein